MSDIFAALIEKWKGHSDDPANNHLNDAVWKIGEDVWTPAQSGDAMRYMYDPQRASGNKDYYPTRYVGTADGGGVHWNSGIANLGEYDSLLQTLVQSHEKHEAPFSLQLSRHIIPSHASRLSDGRWRKTSPRINDQHCYSPRR